MVRMGRGRARNLSTTDLQFNWHPPPITLINLMFHFPFQRHIPANHILKKESAREIETLINEEALLLAMFLRDDRQTWIPRIVNLSTISAR